jgi:O-acetyl-ADP-ribose deacetylase (regulator of RNase III)
VVIVTAFLQYASAINVLTNLFDIWILIVAALLGYSVNLITKKVPAESHPISSASDGQNKKAIDSVSMRFAETQVTIEKGRIEDINDLDRTAAVVLPANTEFTDDCITDKASSLGAFFLEHFPGKTNEGISSMKDELVREGYRVDGKGRFPLGTTILMPEPFSSRTNLLITATATKEAKKGFEAQPSNLDECVRAILEKTAEKRIVHLRMPVIGSGRGKLDPYGALVELVVAIHHYSTRTSLRHIKVVDIIVREDIFSTLHGPKLDTLQRLAESLE